MNQTIRVPKKGAARKWSEKLRRLREKRPSKELVEILNRKQKSEKVASSPTPADLDL